MKNIFAFVVFSFLLASCNVAFAQQGGFPSSPTFQKVTSKNATSSEFRFYNTSATATNRAGRIAVGSGGGINAQFCADDFSSCASILALGTRAANVAATATLTATSIDLVGAAKVNGVAIPAYSDAAPAFANTLQAPLFLATQATDAQYRSFNSAATTTNRAVKSSVGTGGNYAIQFCDDAFGTCVDTLRIGSRSGNTSGNITLTATQIDLTGTTVNANGVPVATKSSGSFTAAIVGCTTSPNVNVNWARSGNIVSILYDTSGATTCTSNSTSLSFSNANFPAAILPLRNTGAVYYDQCGDNSVTVDCSSWIGTTGTVTFSKGKSGVTNTWTAAGTKGFTGTGIQYTYILN